MIRSHLREHEVWFTPPAFAGGFFDECEKVRWILKEGP